MALEEGFTQLVAGTGGAGGVFSGIFSFVLALVLILLFGAVLILLVVLRNSSRYNILATAFIPSHSGFKQIRLKCGVVNNKKTGKKEFRIKKPNLVINNYNSEWIVGTGRKGLKGAFAKDGCYLVLTSLNKYEMLNPMVVREDGNAVAFVAKNVGKDRLSELMESDVEEILTVKDFLSKYGMQIFFGSVVFIQMLMVILLIQYGNKILGA